MTTGYTVYQEWLDRNLTRQFPLDDSAEALDITGTFRIPTTFMVDMFLTIPPDTDNTLYYVKALTVRRYTIDVEIGYDGAGEELLIGKFTKIPCDAALNSSYDFEPSPQTDSSYKPFTIMTGTLIVGKTEEILKYPGRWLFQSDGTPILSTRASEGLAAVRSFKVGTQIFTGDIALREGSGVTLTPSYDSVNDRTVITISANIADSGELAIPITDDASILANLTSLYGTPVTSVNGIKPDVSGNFTLQPIDCTEFTPIEGGVRVENPCSKPCCDKSDLDDAYTAISELNLRYARMEGYYQSLSRNINELQARLIGLEI